MALETRRRRWAEVQRILGALPSAQLRHALLLLHDLGMQHAPEGDPADLLCRSRDWPLLDLHVGLLDDWGHAQSARRESIEQTLFTASALTFMAARLHGERQHPHSYFGPDSQTLEESLWQAAHAQWATLFAEDSPFWTLHRAATTQDPVAQLAAGPGDRSGLGPWMGLPLMAVAELSGMRAQVPQLLQYTEHGLAVMQALDRLARLPGDLACGRVTPLIAEALGVLQLRDPSGASAQTVFAALLLTGRLARHMQELTHQVSLARAIAAELGLASLLANCDQLDALCHGVGHLLGLKPDPPATAPPPLPHFFAPATDVLDNVLQKAEAALVSAPEFHEAWDVQRHTYNQVPQVTAQAFPSMLVIDILCQHGRAPAARARAALNTLCAGGFRYYADAPEQVVPDTDDLALAIRMVRHAGLRPEDQATLQAPLRWLRDSQRPDGQIPVWLRNHDAHPPLSEHAILYGADCATVEANLLISLLDNAWTDSADLARRAAIRWCRGWRSVGLGACMHYTPMYSLWTALELATALAGQAIDDELRSELHALRRQLCQRLDQESRREDLGPQDAAFLTLASLRNQALPFDPTWMTPLLKQQRPDGFWEGEPIYIVPSARDLSTVWFRSRTITTAFAYHALKHHQARLGAAPDGSGIA